MEFSFSQILNSVLDWFLSHGVRIVLIAVGASIVVKVLHKIIDRAIGVMVEKTYKVRDHIAMGKREATLESVFMSTVKTIIWIIAGLMMVSEFDINIGPLLAGAGIVGLAFGFGGQYLVRDIISGLFIILEDQYRKDDIIEIAGISGVVQDMNLRRTILRDLDGIEHTIPNGAITQTANMSKLWSRVHLDVPVAYETDLNHAISVLNRVGQDMAEDENWKEDFTKPIEVWGVNNFGNSSIDIKVVGETKPAQQWGIAREFRKRIKEAFDRENIEIPYPHQVNISKD